MTTRAALKDVARAVFLASNGGNATSPLSALSAGRTALDYWAANPALTTALSALLSPEEATLPPSPATTTAKNTAPPIKASAGPTVNGIQFSAEMPPAGKETQRFMIAEDVVTQDQWQHFIDETPAWQPTALPARINEGRATRDYMATPDERAGNAAVGISAFAAEAFCEWLTANLPESLAGKWKAVLPTEAQWEYAAKHAIGEKRVTDSVWQWCADSFVPLPLLSAPGWAVRDVASPARSVRGGSYLAGDDAQDINSRGGLPMECCSSVVGLRPALVERH
jgi:formylglycine-generating enzyme required for sulfatase activity